jgi:glycosyltransferase involved in cell wall biosynthesis
MPTPQITVVMPCLNEAETLATCIRKAQEGFAAAGIEGEVLVADNGSTDGSIEIAKTHGARVEHVTAKGYGNALRGGIAAARTPWVIMGDADDSYDFTKIAGFVAELRKGADLVMGCRLPSGGGTISPGAMPWKNRWIGNPSLSFLGRLFFRTPIHDFHCGMRGFTKDAIERMDLRTTGMEFASEMVMKAQLKGLRVVEVPITLHKDGRSRPPHLKPWRDGWRHLRFMLIYSPRWLFLVPGMVAFVLGALGLLITAAGPRTLGGVTLDVGTMVASAMLMLLGFQTVAQAFYAKVFAIGAGLLPDDARFAESFRYFNLERGCIAGLLLMVTGAGLFGTALLRWAMTGFGDLDAAVNLRLVVPGTAVAILGIQVISSSFHLSVLGLNTTGRTPPTPPTRS